MYKKKIILLALIKKENFETINVIIKYLKKNFNFNSSLIILDIARGFLKTFKSIYKDINIFICFYQFINRTIIHLPQLKSKKNT